MRRGGVLLLGATLAACSQSNSSPSACNSDAVAFCKSAGCPLQGPKGASDFAAWCSGVGPFASQVYSLGSCASSGGQEVAVEVDATQGDGGLVYLYYDPTSGTLTHVLAGGTAYGCALDATSCGGKDLKCPM